VISFKPQPLYPLRKDPDTHWIGGSQSWSACSAKEKKIHDPAETKTLVIQPTAWSHYID